jgi:N-acetylmuramoyl-L-alanine amidase
MSMRFVLPLVVLTGLTWSSLAEEVEEGRLKRSLNAIKGIFGGGKKEETPPAPKPEPKPAPKPVSKPKPVAKPTPKPAPKPTPKPSSEPKTAPKVVIKSTKPTSKPSSAVVSKSSSKPGTPTVSVPTAPAKPVERNMSEQLGLTATAKPSPAVPDVPVVNVSSAAKADLDSGGTAQATASDPGSNLPLPAFDGKWEIKEMNGHDFVAWSSIQRFYRFSQIIEGGNKVLLKAKNMFISGKAGESSILVNNVKFVLSYPLAESGGKMYLSRLDLTKLVDPIVRPDYITRTETFDTVVIDAGHGGHDSGARGVYGYEKDYTLQLAKSLQATLLKLGFKVVMTRDTDFYISRPGRVEIANKTPRSIFLSLHFNSGSSAASGLETYSLTPAGSSSTDQGSRTWDNAAFRGNSQDGANIALATAIHAVMLATLNRDGGLSTGGGGKKHFFIDRGIKRARWDVLRGCNRPGILFEGGFVTNGTEGHFIAFPPFRQAMANAIAQGIVNFRAALTPRVGAR